MMGLLSWQPPASGLSQAPVALAGYSFATIYGDLNAAFHVGRDSDIPDVQWAEVTAWFQARIDATEKRRYR
jgi:hypothetical protein